MATQAKATKINAKIDKTLCSQFVRTARQKGQSLRYLLEKAIRHYIDFIAPTQDTIRPEVMTQFRRSTDKNRELQKKLAGR
jgi:hypothetical protein